MECPFTSCRVLCLPRPARPILALGPAGLSHHQPYAFLALLHPASLANLNAQEAGRGSAQPSLCGGVTPQKLCFVMRPDGVNSVKQ
jgi:hypothetical protein